MRTTRIKTYNWCWFRRRTFNHTVSPSNRKHYYREKHHFVNINLIQKWSRDNTKLSQQALEIPSLSITKALDDIMLSPQDSEINLESYLDYRNFSSCLYSSYHDRMMKVLQSHALSFPLTLAINAHHFIPAANNYIPDQCKVTINTPNRPKTNIKLCCIGARSEATLPILFWREFLVASSVLQPHPHSSQNISWVIDFIGPDVPKNYKSQYTYLNTTHGTSTHENNTQQNQTNKTDITTSKSDLTLNYNCNYFHDFIKDQVMTGIKTKEEIKNQYDGYILFNPGIGHEHLRKRWKTTLSFLLEQTNKNILFTAHSKLDSERDTNILLEYTTSSTGNSYRDEKTVSYQPNVFSSRMVYEDPFPPSSLLDNDAAGHNVVGISTKQKNKHRHFVSPNFLTYVHKGAVSME